MRISQLTLARGALWTLGTYGVGQLIRLASNVALARLLAPELFGIMVIVNTVRSGIELLSDTGIAQSIVHNQNADKPKFYNTAWTVQVVRGFVLTIACALVAIPVANFFQIPILALALPVSALALSIVGFASMAPHFLRRRMQFVRLNLFSLAFEAISAIIHVGFALFSPTIWALVFGGLAASIVATAGSYLVVPRVTHRFYFYRPYAKQIIVFGKWIFISSAIYFFSMNFDRFYLGKVVALELLGVYGIARTLSELVNSVILRLCGFIVFPLIASSSDLPRNRLREQLGSSRLVVLILAAIGISLLAAVADLLIAVLYDQRYQAAGWMLPILTMGVWFSILCNVNESTLMGLGKPAYGTVANAVKFGWLLVSLPLAFAAFGVFGAIVVVAVGDLVRYVPFLFGQVRERFSFAYQDLLATLMVVGLVILFGSARAALGFGTSFDSMLNSDLFRDLAKIVRPQ